MLQRVSSGTINYYFVVLINSLACCAVDLFVFISGWYLSQNTTVSTRKVIQLLFQVMLFQTVINTIRMVGSGSFSLLSLFRNLIPMNWFVSIYVAMYCLSPYINVFIRSLDYKQYKSLVILVTILFIIQPTIIEVLEGLSGSALMGASTIGIQGAQWGYTIVTFIYIYLLAGFCRLKETAIDNKKVFILWIGCLLVLFTWKLAELWLDRSISAEHYQNPVVIMLAVTSFFLFNRISFHNKVINAVSKGCFTVYIMHASLIQMLFIDLKTINGSFIGFISGLFIRVFVIYIICTIAGLIYTKFEKLVFDIIGRRLGFYSISSLMN